MDPDNNGNTMMTIDDIIRQLGPSKVTVPINYNKFVQGSKDRITIDHSNQKQQSVSENHPIHLYDRIKCAHINIRGPPPPKQQSAPNSLLSTVAVVENTTRTNTTDPKNIVPHVSREQHFVEIECDSNGFCRVYDKLIGNRFLYSTLQIADPKVSILKLDGLLSAISKFKEDLAKNLGGEKNLFKKLGFSRKKTLTLETMQKIINADDFDSKVTTDVMTYIAKLLKINICILDIEEIDRIDVEGGDDATGWLLLKSKSWEYYGDANDKTCKIIDADTLKQTITTLYTSKHQISKQGIKNMKIQDLRKIAKFFGVKASGKAEITDELMRIDSII